MKTKWVGTVGALALLAAVPVSAASGGPDELWEMTIKVEMPGMPMMMGGAPHTSKVCVQKDKQETAVPMDKNCRMTNFKRAGNKTSYSFKCTGEMEMTGSGEATISADRNSYKGSMQAKGSSEGHAFEMKQSYTGKRVGNCTYDDNKKQVAAIEAKVAEANAGRERICTPDPSKYELTWALYEKNNMCADQRNALCKRAKDIAKEMSTDPAAFLEANEERQNWADGMSHCGIDPDKIAPPCKQGVAKKNWEFVAVHCGKETTAIAKKECAGRDYTSAMESEYRPICQQFASQNAGKNVFKEDAAAVPKKKSSVKDAVTDETAEKLKSGVKGLFGF